MPPRVSVVVITWNGRALLERYLPSVLKTTYPDLEVVVADNASSDGTAAWLRAEVPEVRVVAHPENLLFAEGNNRAVPHTTGELVCFLNNDVEVPPDWLGPLVRALDDPGVAAVQPKLLQDADRTRFEYAGASGGWLDRFGYPFARGRLFDSVEPDDGQYDAARDCFWASGAALLMRRDVFLKAGGFDARFGMHMEEIDLCWRLWRRGHRVRVEPASEVYHLGGGSLPQGNPRKVYYNFRNSLLMLFKNLPPRAWPATFARRAALDGLATSRALSAGRPAEVNAIRRAYRDAHRMRHLFEADRPAPGDPEVLPPYTGSIALDHHLRGKARFRDLDPARFAWLAPEDSGGARGSG